MTKENLKHTTSKEIREQFLNYFKKKDHKIIQSSPVVPFDDPTLLFTNAGMNQFKDVFLGNGRRDYSRAVDTQKCIRVSGKHNDLEEVGYDTYHHTFFEMLGNWSFGDYYKKEAIVWAWELLTNIWSLPKERLWATVFEEDYEAYNLWKKETDIDSKHILRFGNKDNFWEMGDTGPCGPSSEIHINTGNDFNNPKCVNANDPECIEIWNLVFIQYNKDDNGDLHELPQKHIDTGMGFERICSILQNKKSNYETDIFTPLVEKIVDISGAKNKTEEDKIPIRVIADHIRALVFAIADGAVPGNEGRGYVLRRILRRAARYGKKINMNEPFLYKLVDILVKTMGDVFPEIKEKKDFVKKILKAEEESFNITIDRGIELFNEIFKQLKNERKKKIPGSEVFKLYDTFGFPADLTNVMAKEVGLEIDEQGFNTLMNKQKERSREALKEKLTKVNISTSDLSSFNIDKSQVTEFTGYDELKTQSKIIGHKKEVDTDLIILDRTPFYIEAGGQVDDTGNLKINSKDYGVVDLLKIENNIVHVLQSEVENKFSKNKPVVAEIDKLRRWDIMRNHSATHFLHSALRKILGTHVQQAGSYVGPDHLRFDFTHYSKLTPVVINEIESLVNDELRANYSLQHYRNIPFDKAKKMGALMFFGDKYGDHVNVVQFGDFTIEFCGGTHVKNSSEIGLIKIVSESSIASGVRRIEAVTGKGIQKYILEKLETIKHNNKKIEELLDTKKKLEKDLAQYNIKNKLGQLDHLLALSSEVKGVKIYKGKVTAANMDELKSFGDEVRNKMKRGVGVLVAKVDDKVGIVAVVSDDLIKDKKLSAGKIVGELAKIVGGGGGGKAHLATAGGKDISKIPTAIGKVEEVVRSFL